MNYFLITGLYRSGTTLLETIIQNHNNVFAANQPLPNLYYYIKENFNSNNNIQNKIVLDTLFSEKNYKPSDFKCYLDNLKITKKDLEIVFKNAKKFSGAMSTKIFNIEHSLSSNTFADLYSQICDLLSIEYQKENVKWKGTKEILAEEYIEYLLDNNIKILLIIRDIRDVINSLNYGNGNDFTGNIRPTLFNIRNWRKSVAYAIEYQDHSNFLSIKYEDLVSDTESEFSKISNFLNISPLPTNMFENELKDQENNTWNANSSFENYKSISNKSIGRYKKNLDPEYIQYIESLCFPELHFMNYKVETKKKGIKDFNTFIEPIEVNHKLFEPDYSYKKQNLIDESLRQKHLEGEVVKDIDQYFIFNKAAEILKKVYCNAK